MGKRLEGKVTMITGAGLAIGRATASIFATDGTKVIENYIELELGEKVAKEINRHGGQALFLTGDVSRKQDVVDMVKIAEK